MSDFTFSIIIPVYNRENCVEATIQSILSQSIRDWELIIVDDGSTDATGTICRQYAQNHANIRYIYQKNGGVCVARNHGMREANGRYILFVDSDNTISQNALECLSQQIKIHPQADLFCYGCIGGHESWIPKREDGELEFTRTDIRQLLLPTHLNLKEKSVNYLDVSSCNKCYKASFLKDHDIRFDESRRTWEDGIFVVNCLDKASSIVLIPSPLYNINCDEAVSHLSGKLYLSQIPQQIIDETEFMQRFGAEFDFNNQGYCQTNMDILIKLFQRAVREYKKDSIPVIRDGIKAPIVHFWASHLEPGDDNQQRVVKCINAEDARGIYRIFHRSIFKRAIGKIARILRLQK